MENLKRVKTKGKVGIFSELRRVINDILFTTESVFVNERPPVLSRAKGPAKPNGS